MVTCFEAAERERGAGGIDVSERRVDTERRYDVRALVNLHSRSSIGDDLPRRALDLLLEDRCESGFVRKVIGCPEGERAQLREEILVVRVPQTKRDDACIACGEQTRGP